MTVSRGESISAINKIPVCRYKLNTKKFVDSALTSGTVFSFQPQVLHLLLLRLLHINLKGVIFDG